MTDDLNIILQGTVGSHAYGLARPDSDHDQLGVFVRTPRELLGLRRPEDTIVKHEPDETFHEIGKFIRLLVKCNPTVTELLWLDPKWYSVVSPEAEILIATRDHFLTRGFITACIGTATTQARRAHAQYEQGDARREKLQRHSARYLEMAYEALLFRKVTVKLSEDQAYTVTAVGQLDVDDFSTWTERRVAEIKRLEEQNPLPLPDEEMANSLLLSIRNLK